MLAGVLLLLFLLYLPTPYMKYEPGLAEDVRPMVIVAEGESIPSDAGQGRFLMTTVKLSAANYWQVIRSSWDSSSDLVSRRNALRGYSEEEYMDRMSLIMEGSQSAAIEAAYRSAALPYEAVPVALAVTDVPETERGDEGLKAGDIILRAGKDRMVNSIASLIAAIPSTGGKVPVEVRRGKIEQPVRLTLDAVIPDEGALTPDNLSRALGGIVFMEQQSVRANNPKLGVRIEAGSIGGPSAGLMFALQAQDLLTDGDLTDGLIIAGTGTLTAEGSVGPIGGIPYKITAAHQAGAQLFLAPAGNYAAAAARARSLGTTMKVVPVRTLNDAIRAIQLF